MVCAYKKTKGLRANNMKKLIMLISLIALPLHGITAWGEESLNTTDWVLVEQTDQIKVFTKKIIDRPSLREIKAIIQVPQSPQTLLNLMMDYPNATTWRRRTKGMELVKTIDDNNWFVNYTTDLPWPLPDRLVLLKCKVTRDTASENIIYSFKSAPIKDGIEPEEQLEGEYRFISLANGQTEVTYKVIIESPVKAPAWLENSLIGDAFLTQMEMLREAVALPKYISHN